VAVEPSINALGIHVDYVSTPRRRRDPSDRSESDNMLLLMLFSVDSKFGRGVAPRLARDFQKCVEISESVRVILVGDMNVVLRLDKNLVSGSLILVSPASVGGFACS
jgi:hypothetical protein